MPATHLSFLSPLFPSSPPSFIPSLPPQAQETLVFFWDKASCRRLRLNPDALVPQCFAFWNSIPPIKTGNTGVCHQGASPENTRPEIRVIPKSGNGNLRSWYFCKPCLVSVGNSVFRCHKVAFQLTMLLSLPSYLDWNEACFYYM